MTLVCTKCDRSETEREGNEIHCRNCGNVAIDGVNARWPFKEREMKKETGATQEIMAEGSICPTAAKNLSNNGQSPLQLAQGIREKEADMSKKKCSIPGCEKVSWIQGLCHRHYTEKNGEYIQKKRYLPREKKVPTPTETKGALSETKTQEPRTKSCKRKTGILNPDRLNPLSSVTEGLAGLDVGDVAVIVKFTDHTEILDNLMALAKKEFRNIDAQILYIVDQYFKDPHPTMLSPILEACGGCSRDLPGAKNA